MSLVLQREARRIDRAISELEEATSDFSSGFEDAQLGESLAHPKHSASLAPIREGIRVIIAKFFRRQKAKLIRDISEHLKHVAAGNKNLKEREQQSIDAISYALPDGYMLPTGISAGMAADYSALLKAAIQAGYLNLADELSSAAKPGDTFVEDYLRENSLAKLTGNLSPTTVDRLRMALADSYEDGATFEEMVQAIQDEYAGFSDSRAATISQTESNDAYNGGRHQLGLDLGFNEKSWNPDGLACPICLANVLQGWIPIGDEFGSGDEYPTAHPNCNCSLDVRQNNDAEQT
jgi:hypothetical protein